MKAAVFLLFAFCISLMLSSSHGASNFLPEKFKAQFTQEYKSVVTGKIKRGNGQIEYQHPGKLRFEMFTPDPLTFVSNSNKNWLYRPPFIKGEQGELKKNVEGAHAFSKFFDALKAGLTNNSYYQVTEQGKAVDLIFSKKSAEEISIEKASLNFKDPAQKKFLSIRDITLHYKNGKKTKIIFNELALVPSFPIKHFTFKTPVEL